MPSDASPEPRVTAGLVARCRETALRVLDTVPPLRRTVEELVRVEFIDRSMVVAAQAMLALVPLVVVLAAFLPADLTSTGADRFQELTGISEAASDLVLDQVEPVASGDEVRAQTGLVGLVVTLLSASSFARALMRAYERVWALPTVGGLGGRRRALAWLLGWLVAVQALAVIGWFGGELGDGRPLLTPLGVLVRAGLLTVVWWWTFRVLVSGRISWRRLLLPAVLTGIGLTGYAAGSTLVMPQYTTSSAEQFGPFGVVLAVSAWLVGFAGVLVVTAVVGRVLVEDPWSRDGVAAVRARWQSRGAGQG